VYTEEIRQEEAYLSDLEYGCADFGGNGGRRFIRLEHLSSKQERHEGRTRDTYISLKLGGIPFHEPHKVARLGSKECFMTILKFRSEVLASEVIE
jgi:hypothetical protein